MLCVLLVWVGAVSAGSTRPCGLRRTRIMRSVRADAEFETLRSDSLTAREKDWTARCSGQLLWWGTPIVVGIAAGQLKLSLSDMGLVWAGALAWMGAGCVLNALRCGRLHCFLSGPALWCGAIAATLFTFKILSGVQVLNDILWATAAFVVVSYLPEAFFGKYVRRT